MFPPGAGNEGTSIRIPGCSRTADGKAVAVRVPSRSLPEPFHSASSNKAAERRTLLLRPHLDALVELRFGKGFCGLGEGGEDLRFDLPPLEFS